MTSAALVTIQNLSQDLSDAPGPQETELPLADIPSLCHLDSNLSENIWDKQWFIELLQYDKCTC